MKRSYLILLHSLLAIGLLASQCLAETPAPSVEREFRAAWIATVANIDWPSRPGLSPEEQRQEMIALLDLARDLRMNAVVFQVRPGCDAMYESQLEPWSEYLTGTPGEGPADGYDPLEFAVQAAHDRGLELHAWFNPYRAWHASSKSEVPPNHISKTHPEMVKKYGSYLWLDPGDPAAANHSCNVILDVVRRYDIDAIHFDDYFYPYPVTDEDKQEVPFPDDASWAQYKEQTPAAQRLSRDDWRRDNVNRFLARVAKETKQIKPWVRFGVSPFGIYRPGHPASIQGFDAYDKLYADSKKWLNEGTVDYFSPQLYWPIDQKAQSFPVLLKWWQQQNTHQRHLWPGLFTSKVLADGAGWKPTEIEQQIDVVRTDISAPGHIHFSIKAIQQNRSGLQDLLREQVYTSPALPPATTWCQLPNSTGGQHSIGVAVKDGTTRVALQPESGKAPWLWLVQCHIGDQWQTQIIPGGQTDCTFPGTVATKQDVVVYPVDRLNQIGNAIGPSEFETN
ncbi:family 10 glycosylhydrolase [Aeoliella sp. ICT_H6.2]|uniref:Family 10 glycosylhydrolase n=1 Tax=Aeoliella straminimaris TaxID=2954799 RepID=A0A9X2FF90_9BACT|nr:family 10 glycosylhydrolase [Aeoliella straminimaris]MCO6048092.1 family 10 glycosylhydrolase [Aeoliella straminimaris]